MKVQCFIPPFLEERTSLRKDAPKQANYEELAYDDKTSIYTKTAFVKNEMAPHIQPALNNSQK
jgi:hypothetical protein